MTKIAFILLCHKDAKAIINQAMQLTSGGDCVAIHFDGRAAQEDYDEIQRTLAGNPGVTFARRRLKCGWGEWSLVEATIEAVRAAESAFPDATHFYMVSGDCMAVKSAIYTHRYLEEQDADFIECFDFFESEWIKTGFKEERLIYRHFFNERTQKKLFYWSYDLQQKFGLTRPVPEDMQIMIGSQWWCLRRHTIEAILKFIDQRADVVRFFRTTWIPDETFFQTLVPHLVPDREIRRRTLTFLMFTDYGMPVVFYNDHYDLLVSQDYLFARKISPEAKDLRLRLGQLYGSDRDDFQISGEGRNLFKFQTGRGRVGQRFAPRFWEEITSVGRGREVLVVVCKKWHVAKRFVQAASRVTGLPSLEYMFNEDRAPLPDLGGIQTTVAKRTRHRRALLRMLFEYFDSDKLVVCLDPSNVELMSDFESDRATMRVLEIECDLSDDFLRGHATRVGLASERSPSDLLERLIPAVRADLTLESERMRDMGFTFHHRVQESGPEAQNVAALVEFFGIKPDAATEIIHTPYIFSD
ncbi:Glycosyl transferase family 14 [Ketogulonicigenium robustum]|uniref:Peptide O-xylosyltransferase n=1 Tax=Ketogulonicigenium robustum TaxID=92947 RepID=A0A1W6P0N2_9RHOB|nr:DUF5928 domain-containing protein [Ketogulonicigenium robustum]ARO14973.1 Glycosyl transferase family 14 [Ketogulonicigenium robustum]